MTEAHAIGSTTRPYNTLSCQEALARIARAGYGHVALFAAAPERKVPVRADSTAAEVAAVRQAAADAGVIPSMVLARTQLERALEMMPEDPETHLLLGRLWLAEAENEKDPAHRSELRRAAAAALREAIRLEPDRPEPHRELGLLAYGDDDFATACVQFRQYLELVRDAEDAGPIRDYVLELERAGECPS